MLCLRKVNVVYQPPNSTSVLQLNELFEAVLQGAHIKESCCSMARGKDIKLEINVLQAVLFTGASRQQEKHMTVVNCFHLCSCGYEFNAETNLHSIVIVVVVVVIVVVVIIIIAAAAAAAVVIIISGGGCDDDEDWIRLAPNNVDSLHICG